MNITILCAGSLKEKYLKDAEKEYLKRLSRYAKVTVIETKEYEDIEKEGEELLKKIKEDSFAIALAICGDEMSSKELALYLEGLGIKGESNITFVIGGSEGLSQKVLERADIAISFSKLTFPHQLIRIFLLEQIYRSFKIIKNEPYHK